MQLFELFGSIVIDANGAKKQISDVTNHAEKSGSRMVGAFTKVGRGFGNIAKGAGKVAGAVGVFRLVDGAINAVSNSIGDAVSRVDTLNTFPTILQQMGATSEEAQASIDRLSEGIDGLPTTLDGIASHAQRMFTILGDAELATESTLALNNAFLASGASTADASRGLEQYMQMLSAGKVDMQSWRTLQETMPYALQKTAEAFGFTGQSATNDFYSALQSGEITMEEFNAKMIELSEETGGFAEVAKTATGGIATSWQNLQTSIVKGVANVIGAVDEWLASNGFGGIAEQINNLKGIVDSAFGWIVERVPAVLDTLKGLFDGIKGLFSGEGLGNFDLSGMINSLMSAIPQLVQKGQEIIQALVDGIVTNLPMISKTIVNGIQTYAQNISVIYPMLIEAGVQLLTSLIQGIIQALPEIVNAVMNIITALVDTIMGLLPVIIEAGISLLQALIEGIVQLSPQLIEIAINIIGVLLEALLSNLPQIIQAGIGIVQALVDGIIQLLPQLTPMAVNLIHTVYGAITENLPMIIQAGVQLLLSLIDGVLTILPQLISTAITLIIEVAGALLANLPEIISAGIEIIFALIDGLIKAIPDLVGAIPQIVDAIFNAFAEVDWWEIGKGIIEGIAKGIGDFAGSIIEKGKEVAENALGGIKKFLGINSPSRVFADEVGKWISAGIAVGIEENADFATDAFENLSRSLIIESGDFRASIGRTFENSNSGNATSNSLTQNITINSPKHLNANETAKQIKKASRQLALE